MDFGEKGLYHQIHPAKRAADVSGSIVSTYLTWRKSTNEGTRHLIHPSAKKGDSSNSAKKVSKTDNGGMHRSSRCC
jgi:hypothetical protein